MIIWKKEWPQIFELKCMKGNTSYIFPLWVMTGLKMQNATLAWKSYLLKKLDFKWSPGYYYVTQDCRHRGMRRSSYWDAEKWPTQCQVRVPYCEPSLLCLCAGSVMEQQLFLCQIRGAGMPGRTRPLVLSPALIQENEHGIVSCNKIILHSPL